MTNSECIANKVPHVIPTGCAHIGRQHYNLTYVGIPCIISEEDPGLSAFLYTLRKNVYNERRMFIIDGVPRMACINWLRDHVHMMKAYKHWEHDLKGYIDFAIENQNEEGFFYEIVSPIDDNHTDLAFPDCIRRYETSSLAFIRLEIEADVEYLVVEGATTIYHVTGDREWLKKILPRLEKAINYCTTNPKRWDSEHGLVKRAFTIDSWDFKYRSNTEQPGSRSITPDTPMSIMHGDNSGVYQAMLQLAWLNDQMGNSEKKAEWEERAEILRKNLDRTCWNGKFYTHQVHLRHDGCPGVNENEILSLSNAYDINRGVASFEQIQSIIAEYQKRRETAGTFAEWFSINPPYPDFGGHPKNTYINGGIASFTAGELAKAAFNNGHEAYGWDILKRLRAIVERDHDLYFLYDPFTRKNMGGGPSGWGAASVICAIDEGLAGITDTGVRYNTMKFSPCWAITGMKKVKYITGYELSKVLVETVYTCDDREMVFSLSCPSRVVSCHILLPQGKKSCFSVLLNGAKVKYEISKVNDSVYIDFEFAQNNVQCDYVNWPKVSPNLIEIVFC